MKPLTCCMSAIVLLAAAASAYADAKSDAAARAKAVAPFVEAETAIVAHVDLTRVDPAAAVDLAVATSDYHTPKEIAEIKDEATKELQTAIRAGRQGVLLVVTLGMFGNRVWEPKVFVVVPLPPNVDAAAIRAACTFRPRQARLSRARWHSVLTTAPRRLANSGPATRPKLAAALEAASDAPMQVALIPPADALRVIEELLPQFPKELGGGPTTILTRGVSWAAAGVDLPPHPAIRLTIKSADAQAAEALCAKLADMMRLAGLFKEVRAAVPKYDGVAAVLAPKVEGDRLVLVLNVRHQGVDKLLSLVTPPIEAARTSAMRHRLTNNLKQIGLAMHNYADANKYFPSPASFGKDGKPLLSWRVYILACTWSTMPFSSSSISTSPGTARTIARSSTRCRRSTVSRCRRPRRAARTTSCRSATGPLLKPTSRRISKTSRMDSWNTIMVVAVDDEHAVIWTKPEDWSFDQKDPSKGLGRFFEGGFNAGIL